LRVMDEFFSASVLLFPNLLPGHLDGHGAAGVVGGVTGPAITGAVGAENTCSVTPCAS
jgi:hypothetical protein